MLNEAVDRTMWREVRRIARKVQRRLGRSLAAESYTPIVCQMGKSSHQLTHYQRYGPADHISLAGLQLEKRWYPLDRLIVRRIFETIIDTSCRCCYLHHSRRSPAPEVPVVSEQQLPARCRCGNQPLFTLKFSDDSRAGIQCRSCGRLAGIKTRRASRRQGSYQYSVAKHRHNRGQNVDRLASFGTLTCSTAHEAYSTQQTRDRFAVPLPSNVVYISPEQYRRTGYEAKENILVVSQDAHPLREEVLRRIKAGHPQLRVQVVQDLTYTAYKRLISRAKWTLTFGEGLDGYFIEPIFSGGIAFTVFNERFFTPEFASVKVVYHSWEELMSSLPGDIEQLDKSCRIHNCVETARTNCSVRCITAKYTARTCGAFIVASTPILEPTIHVQVRNLHASQFALAQIYRVPDRAHQRVRPS